MSGRKDFRGVAKFPQLRWQRLDLRARLDELKTDGSDPPNAERRAARPAYQRALKAHS
jgi:hypothetical protein